MDATARIAYRYCSWCHSWMLFEIISEGLVTLTIVCPGCKRARVITKNRKG